MIINCNNPVCESSFHAEGAGHHLFFGRKSKQFELLLFCPFCQHQFAEGSIRISLNETSQKAKAGT